MAVEVSGHPAAAVVVDDQRPDPVLCLAPARTGARAAARRRPRPSSRARLQPESALLRTGAPSGAAPRALRLPCGPASGGRGLRSPSLMRTCMSRSSSRPSRRIGAPAMRRLALRGQRRDRACGEQLEPLGGGGGVARYPSCEAPRPLSPTMPGCSQIRRVGLPADMGRAVESPHAVRRSINDRWSTVGWREGRRCLILPRIAVGAVRCGRWGRVRRGEAKRNDTPTSANRSGAALVRGVLLGSSSGSLAAGARSGYRVQRLCHAPRPLSGGVHRPGAGADVPAVRRRSRSPDRSAGAGAGRGGEGRRESGRHLPTPVRRVPDATEPARRVLAAEPKRRPRLCRPSRSWTRSTIPPPKPTWRSTTNSSACLPVPPRTAAFASSTSRGTRARSRTRTANGRVRSRSMCRWLTRSARAVGCCWWRPAAKNSATWGRRSTRQRPPARPRSATPTPVPRNLLWPASSTNSTTTSSTIRSSS